MKRCIIIGAGEGYLPEKVPEGFVIAADGGYNTAISAGIIPDVLIGDLDSIEGEIPADTEVIRHPVEKDETDLHLAYLEGVRRGYTDFLILGCSGGRSDHTFASYSLLLYAKNRAHSMTLFGRGGVVRVIKNETVTLKGARHSHFSLFAFGKEAYGVSIEGAEYNASNITLCPEFPLACSNRFLDGEVKVSVTDGALLAVVEDENYF